jgi:lipoate-protein ligase A
MLFERLVVHDDGEALDAALNMAVDEALLEHATVPILRFYGWQRPSLSFGYFGKFAEVAGQAGVRVTVRRWTGGGVVPHGLDLTYSLMTPVSDPASSEGPATIYRVLHRAIHDALLTEGIETRLAEESAPKVSESCFANPVRHDLLSGDRKIAGAAQRRTRRGFLHQGSIQIPNLSVNFRNRFASILANRIMREQLGSAVRERAAILAEERYRTEEWLRRW